MGWRISFGVGPLRYSAPLTRRRRTTRRYVQPPTHYAAPSFVRSPRQIRNDRIVKIVAYGIVALLVVFMIVAGLTS